MLETLSKGFKNARDRLRGVAELSDENIAGALSGTSRLGPTWTRIVRDPSA
jgi:hypothetical protein